MTPVDQKLVDKILAYYTGSERSTPEDDEVISLLLSLVTRLDADAEARIQELEARLKMLAP